MKKITVLLIILVLIPSLSGCNSTKQEVDKLSLVLAAGFDLGKDNQYIATIQILNPNKNPSGSSIGNKGSQQNQSDVIVYSMEGRSPRDAISKLSTELGNNLFFGHSKYTVIGKDLAETGMDLIADTLLRNYDTRANTIMLIANGKASDIISATTSENKISANVVEQLIKLQKNYGYAPVVSRLDFANSLYNKNSAPVLGVISMEKNNEYATLKLAGTAIFDKNKLAGFMDMYQTRGMQWIKGNVKDGSVAVPLPNKKIVVFSILSSKSKIKSKIENGKLVMEISVKEEGNVVEMTAPFDPMKNYKDMDTLSSLQSHAIEGEIQTALEAAQKQYGLDIFNFSGTIKREHPEYWNKIEKDWNKLFPDIKVKVYVNAEVKRTGFFSKSIK